MITRTDLCAAIEAALAAPAVLMPAADAERLREVGRTARAVGFSFDDGPGCPVTQAGLRDDFSWPFVVAYDEHPAVRRARRGAGRQSTRVIEVVA